MAARPAAPLQAATITSSYASPPPAIDGVITFGEWQLANRLALNHGSLTVHNDSTRLYVLLNMSGDSGDDPRSSSNPDYLWLTFDTNRDGAITPNVDLNYGLARGTANLRYQYYLGPGSWTGLVPGPIRSSLGVGFGCFLADGSFTLTGFFPPRFSCARHRVWELAIDLREIGAQPGGTARLGVRVASATPGFVDDAPANFYSSFSDLIEVSLAAPPTPIPPPDRAASITLESNPVELTQAIQTRTNTLPLVEDKPTVARVYVDVNGVTARQPVVVYLYGSRDGNDLPGSPLSMLHLAPATINRAALNDTANFLLPPSWLRGNVQFRARVTDLLGNDVFPPALTRAFTPQRKPLVWIVPVNTGTATAPTLVSSAEIAGQESYMETIFPVADVRFEHKPWQSIGAQGSASLDTIKSNLNTYRQQVLLAWVLSVIFTGKAPFELPEQIYGMTNAGGGSSDPIWLGGAGAVAAGFRGTSREGTMAHEINHNLDRDTSGTWGRHVNGCSAAGPDPNWPYNNDDIQEVGFDTRLPWSDGTGTRDTAIPATVPDIMSYCQSGRLPTKWISPYRWQHLFNRFNLPMITGAGEVGVAQVQRNVLYVSGRLTRDGAGTLNPLLIQPGIVSTGIAPGEYAIEVLNSDGAVIQRTPFPASFVDPEGDVLSEVSFSFELNAPSDAAQVVLRHGARVLDSRLRSRRSPTVTLLQPNGGEQWSGVQTIRWSASDPDGDALSATLLYSPDDGGSWYPVAGNLQGNAYSVDTATLPAGRAARLRVIVSDGFNNAQDDSDAVFAVLATGAERAPQAVIVLPESGAQAPAGARVVFEGAASDVDEPVLPDEVFIWSSGGTVFGVGRRVEAVLPNGAHEITLTVVDRDGNQGRATRLLLVGTTRNYLPLVLR